MYIVIDSTSIPLHCEQVQSLPRYSFRKWKFRFHSGTLQTEVCLASLICWFPWISANLYFVSAMRASSERLEWRKAFFRGLVVCFISIKFQTQGKRCAPHHVFQSSDVFWFLNVGEQNVFKFDPFSRVLCTWLLFLCALQLHIGICLTLNCFCLLQEWWFPPKPKLSAISPLWC